MIGCKLVILDIHILHLVLVLRFAKEESYMHNAHCVCTVLENSR